MLILTILMYLYTLSFDEDPQNRFLNQCYNCNHYMAKIQVFYFLNFALEVPFPLNSLHKCYQVIRFLN